MYTTIMLLIVAYGFAARNRRPNLATPRINLPSVQRLLRICPTRTVEVVLNFTLLHILVESVANGTAARMINH